MESEKAFIGKVAMSLMNALGCPFDSSIPFFTKQSTVKLMISDTLSHPNDIEQVSHPDDIEQGSLQVQALG